ncbi:hypothetical protein [Terribacillus saccharophilus]|uniref:Uncharacterized protein n=1 Tax=Terribacillus saccharophilus TaxID=361277 RepID=A0ABX4H0L2_9BACI|nr:hypothetical protein [Terribacillus saccharophilus]PAD33723.1 hypothetical protein CHH56_17955 [Terribacillus saccharophilus]PAD95097.1 hypothetical protein CHH50_15350 [Terribacillus saccharophilus]PAE00664.1 hypothetical protein CHH48_05845 [Terribacillus saccharophilus]
MSVALLSYKNFFKGPAAISTLCALLSLTLGTLNLLLIMVTPELWKQLNFLEGFVINTVVFSTLISFVFAFFAPDKEVRITLILFTLVMGLTLCPITVGTGIF